MTQKVKISKNETHWQSANIKTMVTAALKHSAFKPGLPLLVEVNYTKESWGEYCLHGGGLRLTLDLPRRGPKLNSTLRALAGAAVSDQPILPVEVVWWLTRSLAYEFMRQMRSDTLSNKLYNRKEGLRKSRDDRTRPSFLPADTYITRYAKPKRAAKKTFLEQVEDDLTKAEIKLDDLEDKLKKVGKQVKKARKALKTQQKRLRDGRARAEERGEDVEFIGRGHRLQGRL